MVNAKNKKNTKISKSKKNTIDNQSKVLKKKLSPELKNYDEDIRTAFDSIKKDMLEIKESTHQQTNAISENTSFFSEAKEDFVTLDKFNLLKIKLGELNEDTKKIWDIDKKLLELNASKLSESEFDEKSSNLENELEKIRQNVSNLDSVTTKDKEVKKLIEDINKEFDKIKYTVDDIKAVKDSITSGELEKRTKNISVELSNLREEFKKNNKNISLKIEKEELDKSIATTNKQFLKNKKNIEDLNKKILNRFSASSMKKELNKSTKNIELLKQQIANITKKDATVLRKNQAEKFIGDINKEFDNVKTLIHSIQEDNGKLNSKIKIDYLTQKVAKKKFDSIEQNHKSIKDTLGNFTNKKEFNDTFSELRKSILSTTKTIEVMEKEMLKKTQGEKLIKDINKEFDITQKTIKKLEENNNLLTKTIEKELITKSQVEDVVADINKEFNSVGKIVKSNTNDIHNTFKNYVNKLSDYSTKKEIGLELDEVHSKINSLKQITSQISKEVVRKQELKKEINNFNKQLSVIKSDCVQISKFNKLAKEIDHIKILIKKESKNNSNNNKSKKIKTSNNFIATKKVKKVKKIKPYQNLLSTGNTFITIAFITLVTALITFFTNWNYLTGNLTIVSIVSFVLGIVMRIQAISKRSKFEKK